ncbi:hypothetical protein ACFSTC_55840 [Nonomuraea ferruginea]
MNATDTATPVRLPGEVNVVNIGLPLFAEAIAEQKRPVVQVDWRIPGGGDAEVVAALRRLYGRHAATIDAANKEVFRRLDRGAPQLVGVRTAGEVIPILAEGRVLLHCGPRIAIEDTVDPLRRSMRAAVCAEGWARDPEEADALLLDGSVRLELSQRARRGRADGDGDGAGHARVGRRTRRRRLSPPTRRSARGPATWRGSAATPPARSTVWCCCARWSARCWPPPWPRPGRST